MQELSASKDRELRKRARDWFYYTGFVSADSEDVIQEAMLNLYEWHRSEHSRHDLEEFADLNWKRVLRNKMIDYIRKTNSYNLVLERYADSTGIFEGRQPFIEEARSILNKVLPRLTEAELTVVIAVLDNNFNYKWAAEDLGCSRQHIYQTFYRIRDRMSKDYDLSHNPISSNPGAPVEYVRKYTDKYPVTDAHWNMFHPNKTEVVDIDELTRDEFWDREEAAKVYPVTIIKGEDYAG